MTVTHHRLGQADPGGGACDETKRPSGNLFYRIVSKSIACLLSSKKQKALSNERALLLHRGQGGLLYSPPKAAPLKVCRASYFNLQFKHLASYVLTFETPKKSKKVDIMYNTIWIG